jgi:hypothetical protein
MGNMCSWKGTGGKQRTQNEKAGLAPRFLADWRRNLQVLSSSHDQRCVLFLKIREDKSVAIDNFSRL